MKCRKSSKQGGEGENRKSGMSKEKRRKKENKIKKQTEIMTEQWNGKDIKRKKEGNSSEKKKERKCKGKGN